PIAIFLSAPIAPAISAISASPFSAVSNVTTSTSSPSTYGSIALRLGACASRCANGLPQQTWHHTSVFARSPPTSTLKAATYSSSESSSSRPPTLCRHGSSIWIAAQPASASRWYSALSACESAVTDVLRSG